MGPLANIFSTIDSTKRKIGGLLDNPLGTFQQLMGQMQDYRREDARLGDIAYGDPRKGEPLVKNEQAFNQLTQRAFDNLMSFAPAGITVWHGSPHKFDKFDSSKIGTGEGAQAYGHGLYVAESPDVANEYRKQLSTKFQSGGLKFDGQANTRLGTTGNSLLDDYLVANLGDVNATRKQMLQDVTDIKKNNPQGAKEWQQALADLRKARASTRQTETGSLYKVDLPDEQIAKMLDWDKPLSQQHPDVQKAIQDYGDLMDSKDWQHAMKTDDRGSWFARLLDADNAKSPRGAAVDTANYLRDAGIPGIRYLDGGSRGTGAGTSNFVVFPGNEGLLSILERNGQPLR